MGALTIIGALPESYLINPSNRADGWSEVMTGTVGNMSVITVDSAVAAFYRKLKFDVELNLGAGDQTQLFVNGGGTNMKSLEASWSAGGATPNAQERAGWVISSALAATTNKVRIWGEMTLAIGQYRYMKCRFISYATAFDRAECHGFFHGTYKDIALPIASVQVCAVGVGGNILAGSRSRFAFAEKI